MANELYVSDAAVADQLGQTTGDRSHLVHAAIEAATARINGYCGRVFSCDTTATARVYRPDDASGVVIDDAWEITAVATDPADDGSYGTAWAATDYVELPINGVRAGRTGWPTTRLEAIATLSFPCHARPSVRVTAKWGWADIPGPVVQACMQLSIMLYRAPDAPFGTAGVADLGLTRVRMPTIVAELLSDYVIGGTGAPMVR